MPQDPMQYAALALLLIELANKIRMNAQQNAEWTPEQEAKFRSDSELLFKSDAWQKTVIPGTVGAKTMKAANTTAGPQYANRRISELLELSHQTTPLPVDLSPSDVETLQLMRKVREGIQVRD